MTASAVRRRAPTNYEIGWSEIWGKKAGTILLLPNETSSVVLQMEPCLKITCLIPAKKRSLTAKYNKMDKNTVPLELDTPDLIWTQKFNPMNYSHESHLAASGQCPCCICSIKNGFKNVLYARYSSNFFLHAVDLASAQKGQLKGSPYRIANVQTVGTICWGSISQPLSLKEAHLKFFGAALNNSAQEHYIDYAYFPDMNAEYVKRLKAYRPTLDNNLYDMVFGTKFLSTDKKVTGVFLSTEEHILKERSKQRTVCIAGQQVAVGFATKDFDRGVWYLDFPDESTWVTENQVTIR